MGRLKKVKNRPNFSAMYNAKGSSIFYNLELRPSIPSAPWGWYPSRGPSQSCSPAAAGELI